MLVLAHGACPSVAARANETDISSFILPLRVAILSNSRRGEHMAPLSVEAALNGCKLPRSITGSHGDQKVGGCWLSLRLCIKISAMKSGQSVCLVCYGAAARIIASASHGYKFRVLFPSFISPVFFSPRSLLPSSLLGLSPTKSTSCARFLWRFSASRSCLHLSTRRTTSSTLRRVPRSI